MPFGVSNPLERRDVDALPGRKPGGGGGGRTVGREARRDGRPVHELLEVGLPLGHLGDPHGQASRGAVRLGRRFRGQAVAAELGQHHIANLLRQSRQPAGRQLFAPDLEQEFPIHVRPRAFCAVSPTYALAIPTASCRTRRM